MFEKYNANPGNKKDAADCVIRAIVKATGKAWIVAYNELCELGSTFYSMPNVPKVYGFYLEQLGFNKVSIKATKGSKRPTVKTFADEHKKGTFVLQIANHVTVVIDGKYYDTWDCGKKSLYAYWEMV